MHNPFDYLRDRRVLLDVIDTQNRIHDELVASLVESDRRVSLLSDCLKTCRDRLEAERDLNARLHRECNDLIRRLTALESHHAD